MEILFISEYFPPKIMGGGEINLSLLAQALAEEGNEVTVLTSFHPGLKEEEEIAGVKIYRRLKTGKNASSLFNNVQRSFIFPRSVVREVKKIVEEKSSNGDNFKIIHFIGTSVIAAKQLSRLKMPLFATIESYPSLCPKGDRIYHGREECKSACSFRDFVRCQKNSPEIGKMKNQPWLKYNPFFHRYVYRYYLKLNEALSYCHLIAISNYVQGLLAERGLKSVVVPNALDVEKFDLAAKKTPHSKSKFKILYLGSLTRFKGPQVLLEAVKGLECRCDLYGEGVLKEELKKKIEEYHLDAEIHPPVPYEEIPRIYASFDLVVFPSTWPEPFGRIAIEAMAAGKPVIGSRIGGIKETIPAECGMLFSPGDERDLQGKIRSIVLEENLQKKMGEEGRKKVQELYSKEKVVQTLVAFYEGAAP